MQLYTLVVLMFLSNHLLASDFSSFCNHSNPEITHTAKVIAQFLQTDCSVVMPETIFDLDLEKKDIVDLTPLSLFTKLESLNLYYNTISDITPLADLSALKELDLSENVDISDLSPLTNLISLEYLDVSDNMVSDLSPLSNLVSLTLLDFQQNAVSDLTPLKKLYNLKIFHPHHNLIIKDEAHCPIGDDVAEAISKYCKNYLE